MICVIKLTAVILAIALLRKTVQKGRLCKEKENEFVIFMLRRVNKMQPSQSNWNFPDFPPVPLSKPGPGCSNNGQRYPVDKSLSSG